MTTNVGTLGTTAQTSLTSLQYNGNMAAADVAAINLAILQDSNPANATVPQNLGTPFQTTGFLQLPGGRGTITLLAGDYVAVDPNTGWPIVISANCAANGAIVHTH